jgi:hypothetical protein
LNHRCISGSADAGRKRDLRHIWWPRYLGASARTSSGAIRLITTAAEHEIVVG